MSRTFRKKNPYYNDEDTYRATMDTKAWFKPPKWFKKMNRRIEKAKSKNAFKHQEDIPFFRKHDTYDWN